MFLAPHVQDDGLVILVSRDGDHAGLAVVPVHGHGGVSAVLKSVILNRQFRTKSTKFNS